MAYNTIGLAKQYTTILDEIYKDASLTGVLDMNGSLIQQGYNANEIVIPKMQMDGLSDYKRANNTTSGGAGGYALGTVTVDYETVKAEYDRGKKFIVDDLDNIETGGVAFTSLAKEFIRTKVVPELDAYRLGRYANKYGTNATDDSTPVSFDLSSSFTGEDVVKKLRAMATYQDNKEVPTESRVLFVRPDVYGMIEDLDTTKSKAVLQRWGAIVQIPSVRFGKTITLGDGAFTVADPIAFMSIEKSAIIQANKIVKPKILTPEQNPDADAWVYGYRLVSYAEAYENKSLDNAGICYGLMA